MNKAKRQNSGVSFNSEYRILNLEDLEKNPYNPQSRTKPKSLVNLKKSIEKRGVRQPIQVVPISNKINTFRVIDGNGRVEASRLLNRTTIPAIINESEEDTDQLFIELNSTSRRLNGRQWLEMIKNGGINSIPETQRDNYNYLSRLSGDANLVDVLIERKTSVSTVYSLLNNMSNHLERENRTEKKKILKFILSMDKITVLRNTFKKNMRKPLLWESIEDFNSKNK